MSSPSYQERLDLFFNLFKGRRDVFPVFWESRDGKKGFTPVCKNEWKKGICLKLQRGKCKDCNLSEYKKFTKKEVEEHLLGKKIYGIYPLLKDNASYFLVVDFDKKEWKQEVGNFLKICDELKIPACLERSKSGNGAHVWIFFEEKYEAVKSRKIAYFLLEKAGIISKIKKETSFDRIFPNQDFLSGKSLGNLIALPLQKNAREKGNTEFLNPKTFRPFEDQWGFLAGIKKVSSDFLSNILKKIDGEVFIENGKTRSLEIFQDNQITLKKSQVNGKVLKFLKEELNIPNPEYFSKKNLGKSTYKTEKYLTVIDENDKEIFFPRGFLKKFINFCLKEKIEFKVKTKRKNFKEANFKSKISLFPYQEKALIEIKDFDEGVILAPPGSGKTVIGLELINEKNLKTLILVHRKELLDQWIERIESFLDIPKRDIGVISGSKKKIGEKITVAMLQSCGSIPEEDLKYFGTILVDECHHIPAKSFSEKIKLFSPKFIYGLTATAKRKKGDEKFIFTNIGEVITEIDKNEINEEKDLKNEKIEIIETSFQLPFKVNFENFQISLKSLAFDTKRNFLIKELVEKNFKSGRILLITERKEHVETLNLFLREKFEVIAFTGELGKLERESKFKQIKSGNFQVLIATGQVFGEGIDIDNLDILILCFPFSFEGKLVQYIGRIQRSNGDKKIIDLRDSQISFFDKMFKERNKFYKKMNSGKQISIFN